MASKNLPRNIDTTDEITRLVELYQEHRRLARALEAQGLTAQAERNREQAMALLRQAERMAGIRGGAR